MYEYILKMVVETTISVAVVVFFICAYAQLVKLVIDEYRDVKNKSGNCLKCGSHLITEDEILNGNNDKQYE